MLRQLEATHDHILGYTLGGDVTDDEYRQLTSQLRDAIALHGSIRVLFRLHDLSLQSFVTALGERFNFVKDHHDDIDRIAIVSDETAIDWLQRMTDTVHPVATRHFSREDEEKAWAWLE